MKVQRLKVEVELYELKTGRFNETHFAEQLCSINGRNIFRHLCEIYWNGLTVFTYFPRIRLQTPI